MFDRRGREGAAVIHMSAKEIDMLGEKIAEEAGKVVLQRVLPNPGGGPKMEVTFQGTGSLLGVPMSDTGTYTAALRPDGTLFGEGQGVVMGRTGEAATWCGQGVGRLANDGAVSYRGAVYFQSASPAWARLNSQAVVFEYEVDAQGNTKAQEWEWK
jgi:hypothetical protein